MRNLIPSHHGSEPLSPRTPDLEQVRAIKRWTSELLKLASDDVVTVSELDCASADCPIIETLITVHAQNARRTWRFSRPKIAITKLTLSQVFAHSSGTTHDSTPLPSFPCT